MLFAEERCDITGRELELCGYFAIVTSDELVAGKLMLEFVALTLRNRMRQLLRE